MGRKVLKVYRVPTAFLALMVLMAQTLWRWAATTRP
jgi:hypothetical protein